MRYTIYKITNKLNGKIYIGKHQTENPNDPYYGSGKAIKDAIRKHGKENFIKEILFDFDTEDAMNLKERELITEEFVAREDTYNLGVGGEGGAHFKGKKHSDEARSRIKQTNKERDWSFLKGRLPHNKGKKDNEETRMRKAEARKRRAANEFLNQQTKQKISEGLKRYYTENAEIIKERKKSISQKKRNRKPLSEETKRKLSEKRRLYWKNKKQNVCGAAVSAVDS